MEQRIKEAVKEIVGEENFTDQLIDLITYSSDATLHKHRPEAAAWPTETEQVAAILKLATQELFPVTPRGAGTSIAGLSVPARGGLILDMGRMNKILKISLEDRLAVVQPGVVYADLQAALAPLGFFFPPDPGSSSVCTIGGNVGANAGGIKGAKYGTTKDYVLALEVILPDGRLLRTGSSCMKSVSGYDLTKLFVGSEGTLGVVTEITLKINPKPSLTATALATFDDLEDAGRAVSEIMHSGVLPSVLEIMDRQIIMAINEDTDLNLPPVEAIILTETDGHTQGEVEYQINKIMEILRGNNASNVRSAESAEEAEALWAARKSTFAVTSRINNNLIVEDVTVPMSKVADMLKAISDISAEYNLKIPTVGHVGDGNLHPVICYDGTDEDETKRVEIASEELFKRAIELGGTLTGEHGIGLSKAPYIRLEHSDVSMEVMASLKRLFDPNNILNPGKMGLEV